MIRLYRAAFPGRPAFDAALSRALLLSVAARGDAAALRVSAADPVLAFSVLDRTRPGFPEAVEAARRLGFEPVLRLAGGRAAVFHTGTLCFAWSLPCKDSRLGIRERFDAMAGIARAALARLGIDARVGEVPGEYCPGAYSVNAGGRRKIVGIGQRLVRGAAHLGGVLVVRDAERIRGALDPVYRALGYDFDPQSVGSVEAEVGAVPLGDAIEALLAEFRRLGPLAEAEPDADELARAEALEAEHRIAPRLQPRGREVEEPGHGRRGPGAAAR